MASPKNMSPSVCLVRTREELAAAWRARRARGARIGLVPTMGALHEGHLSLVDAARRECDLAAVTIFVNPTQFGPGEDLARYPRDLPGDLAMLARRGTDLVFAPEASEIYRPDHDTFVDVGRVANPWEGTYRPTHFRGVATVVLKLFHLLPADVAYFGRKDYQQSLVIGQLVRDLDLPIEIRVCPIIREADGLAMSSRNAYLSPDERRRALVLSQSLRHAEDRVRDGERDAHRLRAQIESELKSAGPLSIDYIAIVRDGTVDPVDRIDGPTTICLAIRLGHTRLIDNHQIMPDGEWRMTDGEIPKYPIINHKS